MPPPRKPPRITQYVSRPRGKEVRSLLYCWTVTCTSADGLYNTKIDPAPRQAPADRGYPRSLHGDMRQSARNEVCRPTQGQIPILLRRLRAARGSDVVDVEAVITTICPTNSITPPHPGRTGRAKRRRRLTLLPTRTVRWTRSQYIDASPVPSSSTIWASCATRKANPSLKTCNDEASPHGQRD